MGAGRRRAGGAARPHPGRGRAVGRKRRAQHRRALWRRCLLPGSPAHRHQAGAPAQARRSFSFQYTMAGLERLYKDGQLAIVHGVGYPQPSFSHFSSMAYWQTAAPNRGDLYGWVGRMADAMDPEGHANFVVNIDTQQSLAVRSQHHVPLVFDDPQKFVRTGFADEKEVLSTVATREAGANEAQEFMYGVSRSALNAEHLVRDAWAKYRTPVDYGLVRFGLDRVAALIAADFPTKIYYVAYRNNA